jgi:hypothetical protein
MSETTRKLFRLAAIDTSDGPLHILWTLDEDGVWVVPWAAQQVEDERALGETISRVGAFSDPRMPAEIVALTRGGARFVALTSAQAATIAAEVAASLTGAASA